MSSRITFLRHGNAAPKEPGQKDGARPLTALGVYQADKRREEMKNPGYGLVITSTSRRADQTATIVAEAAPDVFLDELAPQPEGCALDQEIEEMFLKLGYAPARTWLKNDTKGALRWKASAGLARVLEEISRADHPQYVLVASHSIFVVTMAMLLCMEEDASVINELLSLDIQETGAITVYSGGGLLRIHNDPITFPADVHA